MPCQDHGNVPAALKNVTLDCEHLTGNSATERRTGTTRFASTAKVSPSTRANQLKGTNLLSTRIHTQRARLPLDNRRDIKPHVVYRLLMSGRRMQKGRHKSKSAISFPKLRLGWLSAMGNLPGKESTIERKSERYRRKMCITSGVPRAEHPGPSTQLTTAPGPALSRPGKARFQPGWLQGRFKNVAPGPRRSIFNNFLERNLLDKTNPGSTVGPIGRLAPAPFRLL